MAPKVTSSSTRNKGKASKPVTKGQSPQRANRQRVSTAQVTTGSNGKPAAGGGRVTNASQRTNTGSAPVTGNGRPALPPGQRGGALATNTKPPATRPQLSGTKPPARLPGGTGGADSVRGSGVRTGQPGAARPALPASPAKPPAKPPVSGARRLGGGLVSGTLLTAAAGKAIETLGRAAQPSEWNRVSRELKDRGYAGGAVKPDANGRSSRGIRVSDKANKRDYVSAPTGSQEYNDYRRKQIEAEKQRLKNVGNPPARSSSSSSPARMPSSVTRSSAPKAPTAPAKPGQKWDDFNPNRGTSKTNNPLMKDMIGRMKDREDKAQASSASKLTSKFNTESNFSGEKLDGSMYKDSFKKKKKS
jgi:hypothetical protein